MAEEVEEMDDRFEGALSALLNRAYEPLECRPGFRDGLLNKLKERQCDHASNKTRRRVVVLLATTTGLAAAALLAFSFLPLISPGVNAGAGDSGRDLLASANGSVERGEKAPSQPGAALLREVIAFDSVEYRHGNTGPWLTVSKGDKFVLTAGTQLQPVADFEEWTGLKLDDDLLILAPRSIVMIGGGGLVLESGTIYLQVADKSPVMEVHLPGHKLEIQPGSKVAVRLTQGEKYAPHGNPAPEVLVEDGLVFINREKGISCLFPDKEYRLYDYMTRDLPFRSIERPRYIRIDNPTLEIRRLRYAAPFIRERSRPQRTLMRIQKSVRHINDRVMVFTEGKWVDSEYTPGQPTAKVVYLSAEYMILVRENVPKARIFGLGNSQQLILKINDAWYEIVAR